MNAPLKIAHVITGLQVGGAEMMLCRLLEAMDKNQFACHVVCLGPRGPLAERVEKSGSTLTCLGLGGMASLPYGWWKLTRWLRRLRPDAVHTWMYHADLLGGLAAKFGGGNPPVAWALHHSNAAGGMKLTTRIIVRLLAGISRWIPSRIISCSKASAQTHAEIGYAAEKFEIIFNGVDSEVFQPNSKARQRLRDELAIPQDAPLVGFVGRNVPVKDIPTFLRAATIVQSAMPDAHFLLCGPEMTVPALPNVHVLPFRPDVHSVYPALDMLALTSLSEACPMSLIEAMACGVPCTSTDVGDASFIIDDREAIAPAGNAEAIAKTWLRLLANRGLFQTQARLRVQTHFSLASCVQRYQTIYRQMARPLNLQPSRREILES